MQPGEAYCDTIRSFLIAHVDPDEIERTAKIPDYVLKGLFQLGDVRNENSQGVRRAGFLL